jgi:hypothetical protein
MTRSTSALGLSAIPPIAMGRYGPTTPPTSLTVIAHPDGCGTPPPKITFCSGDTQTASSDDIHALSLIGKTLPKKGIVLPCCVCSARPDLPKSVTFVRFPRGPNRAQASDVASPSGRSALPRFPDHTVQHTEAISRTSASIQLYSPECA